LIHRRFSSDYFNFAKGIQLSQSHL